MSFRVGLDVPRTEWMDFVLDDYPSIEALVEDTGWKLPQKVQYREWRVLLAYCRRLRVRWSMQPRVLWSVSRLNDDGTWTVFWRRGEKA